MTYSKQFSLALSLVAAAGMATPALANDQLSGLDLAPSDLTIAESTPAAVVEPAEAVGVESATLEAAPIDQATATEAGLLGLPEATPANADNVSNDVFYSTDIESVLLAATVEAAPEANDAIDLAQTTRSAYQITPAYLGIGGNIGIGNRGQSGISSFGFNVISKISLGPRFSLRPGVTITNDRSSFTIPLTYNFNTLSVKGFRAQPYVGAGVDVPTSGDVGLMLNAGADVPISRDFTLNGVANVRVTSGFAMGISLGVGYNFPFIFE
ncbi:hypothetical protein IQ254_06355 [Nodosilinea sp. LEGE 07088]|uniref:hypothetical protein n=1 Tax=Nodosilinea sp. LEGE 07088 TaxID=2777968 RepID=UPI00187F61CE|nr:hypothetical protein [Nodosilinea sp. LEGE 07088]MBE9136829.1 hypothetical protein [Nodosilinea sp. LEGE 07088]